MEPSRKRQRGEKGTEVCDVKWGIVGRLRAKRKKSHIGSLQTQISGKNFEMITKLEIKKERKRNMNVVQQKGNKNETEKTSMLMCGKISKSENNKERYQRSKELRR